MEAALRWCISLAIFVLAVVTGDHRDLAAQNARTRNFLVHASDPSLARAVADSAEKVRKDLAMYWLGKPLPPWPTPCPIEVQAGPHLAAQGVTTYNRSPVGNFQMKVIGTPERILDSVLPHEVTHTVLATHFGQPLPRWADEGICTTVEHAAERNKHEAKLREFLSTRRGIAMNRLFLLTEYPNDMLPMYAQGYSVCRFLIQQSGPRRFIKFLEGYMQQPSWTSNVQKHYGYDSLAQLQENWLAWVAQGSGPVESFVSARTKAANAVASSTPPSANNSLASFADRSSPAAKSPAAPRPTATTLLASNTTTGGESWYQRRREQVALDQSAQREISPAKHRPDQLSSANTALSPPRSPLGPPSVTESGRYSVSQPQGEQKYGDRLPMASSRTKMPTYR